MPKAAPGWLDQLPTQRPIAEFSVWSSDLLNIGRDLDRVAPHADMLHIDVADGHFAPSFLFFVDLVDRIRKYSDKPIHVHLMVEDSILASQIDQFAEAGADLISAHIECPSVATDALERIRRHGVIPGLVLRVETPVATLAPYVDDVPFVTLLGTAIGVKGKGLHEEALHRLTEVRGMINRSYAKTGKRSVLVADGGIRHETVPLLRKAGADAVVLGSLAYGDPNLAERMQWLAAL